MTFSGSTGLRQASRARPPLRAGRRRPMVALRRAARRQRRRALRLAGARPGRGGAARGGRARRGAARRAGDIEAMLGHARRPEITFAATDGGPARALSLPSARSDAARPTLAQGVAIDARRSVSGRAGLPLPLRLAEGRRRAHPAPRGRPGAGRGGPLTIEDGPAPVAAGTGARVAGLSCRTAACRTAACRAVSSVGTSARFTRERSLVRVQYCPPDWTKSRTFVLRLPLTF